MLCGWIGQFFHGFNRTFTDAAVVAVVVVVVVVVTIDAPLLLLLAPPRTTTLLNSALFDPLLLLLLNTLQLLLELLKKASIFINFKIFGVAFETMCDVATNKILAKIALMMGDPGTNCRVAAGPIEASLGTTSSK